jgi:4-hydroxybenzoate polyprenyltransferase
VSGTVDPRQAPPVKDSTGNFVDTRAPLALKPYLRLARIDRPIGWWLLLLPCWWGAALASIATQQPTPNPWHLVLFLIGAIVMRGAGCTLNDIVDRDIDGAVERTRNRPIPSGQVTVKQAALFMVALCVVGFMVLVQFNLTTIVTGIVSLAVVAIYPFMKRITSWPQLVLGLAFSWGALVGWTATTGSLGWPAVLLYLGAVAWVIGYDTIYAHQDREDDALVGVRSTARLFGDKTKPWLVGFYAVATALFAAAFVLAGVGVAGYAGLLGFSVLLAQQIRTLDINDADQCLKLFKSNRDAGLVLFLALAGDAALQAAF